MRGARPLPMNLPCQVGTSSTSSYLIPNGLRTCGRCGRRPYLHELVHGPNSPPNILWVCSPHEPAVRGSERRGQRSGWEGERLASRQRFMASIRVQSLEVRPPHEPQVDQPPITRIVADNESRPIRAHPSHPRFKDTKPAPMRIEAPHESNPRHGCYGLHWLRGGPSGVRGRPSPPLMVRRPECGALFSCWPADFVQADLESRASLRRAAEGVDTVLYLGARATFEDYAPLHRHVMRGEPLGGGVEVEFTSCTYFC
jgi:hypothetical protein